VAVEYGSLPFDEALEFFRAKLNLPTKAWGDLLGAAHDRAFVVAGAMQADLLADLKAAVEKAIAEGATIQTFRKDFAKIVAERGWTGWTGEETKTGRAWRTRVIYETNLFTSYSAGRYQQMKDVADARPYWRYRHSDASVIPRKEHQAWDGVIRRHDDGWWAQRYPPSGFGCRCYVETLSEREMKKLGLTVTDKDAIPYNGDVKGVDPKTGEEFERPEGVDKGWDYQPGKTWFPDLDKYDYATAKRLIAANMKDGVFDRWIQRIAEQVANELKKPDYAGLDKKAIEARLRQQLDRKEEYPVAALPQEEKDRLGVSTQVVTLSEYDAIKQTYSRKDDPNFTVDAYRAAQSILENAELIVREGDQSTVWFRDQDGRLYVAVLWQTKTGKGLFLKSLRFGSASDMKRSRKKGGVLLDRPKGEN
jgi:uncharacterized protein with gpF-like domain